MCPDCLPAGPVGLLRVAGLPVTLLARAGNPALFDRIRGRQRSEVEYAEFAARLARQLTDDLVPHPELPAQVRRVAVATRRVLLRGRPVEAVDCRRLAVVNAVLGGPERLTYALLRAAAWSRDLCAEDRRLTASIARERTRLATLPWELVSRCPAALRVVADAAPALLPEIRARLAGDQGWTGKRMRQRADYLLRILGRAACKTTPRGWLGHVAVAHAGPGRADQLLVDAHVRDYAVHAVGNIGEHRRALSGRADLPDAWLSMAGLHWADEERLSCWVADPENPAGARFVQVRRTQPVDLVRQALTGGAVRAADVADLLAPAADSRGRQVVRDFLNHLVRLGVVQASARPAARLRGWTTEPRAERPERAGEFVDVYRRGGGHVPSAALSRLGELVAQARRVRAVVTPPAAPHPVFAFVDECPRPVTDVVARFLDGRVPAGGERRDQSWPAPAAGSPHEPLYAWLAEHAGHEEVDLTPDVLDRLGAPPARRPPWPVDCLVRPLPTAKPLAVLEAVVPAGIADARFADALRGLHDDVSQVDDYRAFLDTVAARCGVEVVEVLIPPHGPRSANTVRRPRYTGAWTGDADPSAYLGEHPGRFLPLGDITVRRDGERVIAEDRSGRPLWPVCHATRMPPPPWDLVLALLSAAAPIAELAAPFLPGDPSTAFPGADRMPRLVVDGGLVLAPRAVVLTRDRLPDRDLPVADRVRRLARLRVDTGAPRWNFARVRGAGRPRPVDLDSITALRVFDKLLADPTVTALVLEEMLPAPEHLRVSSESGEPLAAQLLLRLPHQVSPERLADDVARAWLPTERSDVDSVAVVAG